MKPLQYIFEMLVCSGVFLAVYSILPKKACDFRRLRTFILVCAFLSAIVPFVEIPVYPPETVFVKLPLAAYEKGTGDDLTLTIDLSSGLPSAMNGATDTARNVPDADSLWTKLGSGYALPAMLYLLVVLALGIAVCVRLHRIWTLRRRSQVTEARKDGLRYHIAQSAETESPFSFLRTIYIGCGMEAGEKEMVIAHERSHIRHRHSQERLFMSAMRTLFWFNPFFWIFGKKLEEIQEFEADRDVLSEGYDARLYRLTIFKQLFGYYPEISCGLKNSITKRRFIMMTDKNLTRFAALRWTAAMMLVSGTVFLSSATTAPQKDLAPTEGPAYAENARPHEMQCDAADTLFIDVKDNGKSILLNGNVNAGMNALLGDLSAVKADLVVIRAEADVPMGTIADIKNQLRKSKNLTVIYGSMDDKGKAMNDGRVRRLPPPAGEEGVAPVSDVIEITDVNRNELIYVRVNKNGNVIVTYPDVEKRADSNSEFAGTIAEMLKKNPEAFVSLIVDEKTSYEAYQHTLNQIDEAYVMVRNDYAMEKFGKSLDQLTDDELRAVKRAVPMKVAEAEPHTTQK